jgi:hypothetical protein
VAVAHGTESDARYAYAFIVDIALNFSSQLHSGSNELSMSLRSSEIRDKVHCDRDRFTEDALAHLKLAGFDSDLSPSCHA